MREKVVAEAKSWIGTPYHNCADVKGVGCDCGMLLVRVFVDLGIVEPFDPRPYAHDWHLHRGEERYLEALLLSRRQSRGAEARRRDAVSCRTLLQPRRDREPLGAAHGRACFLSRWRRARGSRGSERDDARANGQSDFCKPLGRRPMSFLVTKKSSPNSAMIWPSYTGLQLQTATNVLPIPLLWGINKLAVNIIYYANFRANPVYSPTPVTGKGGALSGSKGGQGYTGRYPAGPTAQI